VSHADPKAELLALARALRAEAERRKLRGWRGVPRPARNVAPPPELGAAPEPGPAPERALPARASSERTIPASVSPAGARPGHATPARSSGTPASGHAGEAALTPEDVRARAAACADLDQLREAVAACTACPLAKTRTQTVFSDGDGSAGVLFVGEAPGRNEDEQGVPFVGRAGALLTDIIEKGMRLERRHVAIANVLKCRPPENRDPTAAEKALCTPWLDRQIELLAPRVIVPLGRHAAGHLLQSEESMGRMRGKLHRIGSRTIVPTFHPAFLLRSPHMKKDCWADIQLAMAELGLGPGGQRTP